MMLWFVRMVTSLVNETLKELVADLIRSELEVVPWQ